MKKTMKILGLPVKDARQNATFIITKADVKAATRKDPHNCAAAIACKRQFKSTDARVQVAVTYIRNNGGWVRYITPPSLRTEIVAIDRGGRFDPGTYMLQAPPANKRLGFKRKPTGPRLKKGVPRRFVHTTAHVRSGTPLSFK